VRVQFFPSETFPLCPGVGQNNASFRHAYQQSGVDRMASWTASGVQIMAVSDARQRMTVEGVAQHSSEEAAKWQMVAGQTKNMFLTKMGIDIGPLPFMLDVRVCTGHVRAADNTIRKQYAKELVPYPLQASTGCNATVKESLQA